MAQGCPQQMGRVVHDAVVGRTNENVRMGRTRKGEKVEDIRLTIGDRDDLYFGRNERLGGRQGRQPALAFLVAGEPLPTLVLFAGGCRVAGPDRLIKESKWHTLGRGREYGMDKQALMRARRQRTKVACGWMAGESERRRILDGENRPMGRAALKGRAHMGGPNGMRRDVG